MICFAPLKRRPTRSTSAVLPSRRGPACAFMLESSVLPYEEKRVGDNHRATCAAYNPRQGSGGKRAINPVPALVARTSKLVTLLAV